MAYRRSSLAPFSYVKRLLLWTAAGSVATVAVAVPVGLLDLRSLTAKADLVIVGRVSVVREQGPTTVEMPNGSVPAHAMVGTIRVEKMLKGSISGATIDFQFVRPDDMIGYGSIGQNDFGVFFLQQSGDERKILDPYHPYIVAMPGAAVTAGSAFDRVVAELAAVVDSPSAPAELQREAVYALGTTPGAMANEALIRAVLHSDSVVHFDAMAELLQRHDVTYLTQAVELLMHPPPGIEPTLLMNLALGIGAGVNSPSALPALSKLSKAPWVESRRSAVTALARIGGSRSVEPLSQALHDDDREVRYWAVVGLARFTGQDHWYPSLGEYRDNEDKYLKHWREWAQANAPTGK